MIRMYDIIATWFYSGYLKPASGTWGTMAALPLCMLIAIFFGIYGLLLVSTLLFVVGLWASDRYERETGHHDSSHVVIDEAAGMMLASLPVAIIGFNWWLVALCFLGFRLFDAIKLGPVGWLDKNIDGPLGVMIDDIAAGLLAAIAILGLLTWIN